MCDNISTLQTAHASVTQASLSLISNTHHKPMFHTRPHLHFCNIHVHATSHAAQFAPSINLTLATLFHICSSFFAGASRTTLHTLAKRLSNFSNLSRTPLCPNTLGAVTARLAINLLKTSPNRFAAAWHRTTEYGVMQLLSGYINISLRRANYYNEKDICDCNIFSYVMSLLRIQGMKLHNPTMGNATWKVPVPKNFHYVIKWHHKTDTCAWLLACSYTQYHDNRLDWKGLTETTLITA